MDKQNTTVTMSLADYEGLAEYERKYKEIIHQLEVACDIKRSIDEIEDDITLNIAINKATMEAIIITKFAGKNTRYKEINITWEG